MATLLNEGFNGQTNGTTADATTTNSSASGTGVITHSTSNLLEGDNILTFATQSNFRIFAYTLSSRASTFVSIYVYLAANPAANSFFIQVQNGASSAAAAQLGFLTTGQLRLRNQTTQVDATTTFATGAWNRCDWTLLGGSSTQTVRVYRGATLHSSNTADAAETLTGALTDTTMSDIQFGNIAVVTGGWSASLDSLRADDAAMPAPGVIVTPTYTLTKQRYYAFRRSLGLR